MKHLTISLTIFLVVSFMVFAAPVKHDGNLPARGPEAFMERSPGQFNPVEYRENQQRLFNWLMSEAPYLSPESILSIHVTEAEIKEVDDYTCKSCGKAQSANFKNRVGLVKPLNIRADFSKLSMSRLTGTARYEAGGMIQAAPNGGYVWLVAAQSQNAVGLRVHFTGMVLPTGAELYIYNHEGEAFGPYTGLGPNRDGEFWTNTVMGPVAYVQLRFPAGITEEQLSSTRFTISGIGHLGEKFLLPFLQQRDLSKLPEAVDRAMAFCSFNASCVVNASCSSSGAVSTAKDAVAHMQWVSGAYIYICTGGLVADTDNTSQIPYFITANHCISRRKAASALECYWQFTTSCNGSCYNPVGAVPRTLGASVVSTNRTGDYTLMQLNENPPAGSAFLGWNTADVANSNGTNLYRISHPSGAPQAYSAHRVDTSSIVCSGWPRGSWIYSKDTTGATEGGSSGSPVVNSSGQLVGQLSGGCGYNVNDVCDTDSNWTVDGAFASYYTEVMQWLDPSGGPSGGTETHVYSIVLTTQKKGKNYSAIATVTVYDENGDPVENATVYGTFSGQASGSESATTGADGVAVLKIDKIPNLTSFSFCVDNITHGSMSYDSNANVETCDSY